MYPYQLSQVLADQRIHDMLAAAERHRMTAAGRQQQTLTNEPSRLGGFIARLRTTIAQAYGNQVHGRRVVSARPTATHISDAGPIGCSA